MSIQENKKYKKYLEPGSADTIPSSSWYRYKKQRNLMDDQSCNISTNEECAMGTNVLENDAILMNIDDTVENVLENDVSLMNFNDTEVKVSENVTSINFNDNEENFTEGSKDLQDKNAVFNIIQSLEEDINLIGNEVPPFVQGGNEDDDCYLNEIDEDDFFIDGVESSDDLNNDENDEFSSQTKFTSLEDWLKCNNCNRETDIHDGRCISNIKINRSK
ncbi:uncharacterized protein LOC127289491 [Leptopilina boulardi]|uniref:uncharacterized protein LOC127289491 n=1 Tax=Leptopilina boulardi TaxID=63433 RepID=UPI0021F61BC3|nr:uncharacterized protein LOC127289491 [Leptopilina boulardi]